MVDYTKLTMAQIKKLPEYKNIPKRHKKASLNKANLCILLKTLNPGPKAHPKTRTKVRTKSRTKVRTKSRTKVRTKAYSKARVDTQYKNIIKDLDLLKSNKINKKAQDKLLKKYNLLPQEEYLKQKIDIYKAVQL